MLCAKTVQSLTCSDKDLPPLVHPQDVFLFLVSPRKLVSHLPQSCVPLPGTKMHNHSQISAIVGVSKKKGQQLCSNSTVLLHSPLVHKESVLVNQHTYVRKLRLGLGYEHPSSLCLTTTTPLLLLFLRIRRHLEEGQCILRQSHLAVQGGQSQSGVSVPRGEGQHSVVGESCCLHVLHHVVTLCVLQPHPCLVEPVRAYEGGEEGEGLPIVTSIHVGLSHLKHEVTTLVGFRVDRLKEALRWLLVSVNKTYSQFPPQVHRKVFRHSKCHPVLSLLLPLVQ